MVTDGAITVASFSRQERRRMEQAQRTGRGFTPPGQRQPPRSGCCLFLIILVVALIAYAYIDAYVLNPEQKPQQKEKKSSLAPAVAVKMDGPGYDLSLQPSAVQRFVRSFGEIGGSPVREG